MAVLNNSPAVFWCELSQINKRISQAKFRLQRAEDNVQRHRQQVLLEQLMQTKNTLKYLLHEVHALKSAHEKDNETPIEESRQRSRSVPESITNESCPAPLDTSVRHTPMDNLTAA